MIFGYILVSTEFTLKLKYITGAYNHWLTDPYPLVSVRAPYPITVSVVTAIVVVMTPMPIVVARIAAAVAVVAVMTPCSVAVVMTSAEMSTTACSTSCHCCQRCNKKDH